MSEYFLEIEAHFAARRKTPFILSAKDWALMKKWQEDGIPLSIIIEAIDNVFENNDSSGRKKTISSLSYCRHAIKELWDERKELQVGSRDGVPESGPEDLLEALAAELESSSLPAAVLAAASVRALAPERSVPKVEEALMELEQGLIEEILASLLPVDASSLKAEVLRSLGDTSRLDEKTRQRTETANLRRVVRERFGLPRLTLFS